jgi:uncharacterized Zn finger protein
MKTMLKNPANSALHLCNVCGKSRAIKSIDHGRCAVILAEKAKEKTIRVNLNGRECLFSEDQIIAGNRRRVAKQGYIKGDLPQWMFD